MAKKRTPEQRLAEVVQEMGIEKAESFFLFFKAINTPRQERKVRKTKASGASDGSQ